MNQSSSELSAEKIRFIEKLGLYYENYGIPRIGGKILGLILVNSDPVSAEYMSKILKVSRSSISTNVRFLVSSGFLEIAPQSGDRTDYFIISESAWDNSIKMRIEGFDNLRQIIEKGINSFGKEKNIGMENNISRNLEDMFDWTNMMLEAHKEMLIKWKEKNIANK